MKEIRWHARAGQGAKTASQLYAAALLQAGKSVQAFPEYGPERRGAPMRAYTRFDERPIRRHDAVAMPDAVVVLEPSLLRDVDVEDGLREGGLVLVNAEGSANGYLAVPAERLAAGLGSRFVNLVMVGALAAALGEPSLEELQSAAAALLGAKVDPHALAAALAAGWEHVWRG
ncbi:MAG: 2-oxoacid:acceptor oxidoreductase family protein [Thermoleophilia bacterium]|nr:2-oxoacid:acceptor oxidoreductase family protein [Thermoleophilia bacterium]